MKVLVTGGLGFIGQEVVNQLVENNYNVSVIDYRVQQNKFDKNPAINYYDVNINDVHVDEVFAKECPDFVIHLAAQVNVTESIEDPKQDAMTNILGTINILECCKKYKVKKMIFSSSAAVYGEPKYLGVDELHPLSPLSFYGLSKCSAENYIKSFSKLHGINYSILRYSNVYGFAENNNGEGNVISIFLREMTLDKSPIIFGNGKQTRDFIYVKDVAHANLAALTKGNNETINISTNQPTDLNELVATINSLLRKHIEPSYIEERNGDISQSFLNNEKALQLLDWKDTYSLKEGLQATIEEMNE